MIVSQIPVGPMQNFVYILSDEASLEALVVDSGWETSPLVTQARTAGLKVKFVVATHEHYDHVSTIGDLSEILGARVVAHETSPVDAAVRVRHGDDLPLGGKLVRVLHTPGHTMDSICLYDGKKNLFTGDTLFIGAWGRTDLPGGSPELLFRSLHDVILRLPPETVVYPGHDYGRVPFGALGEQAKTNPALRARSVREFLSLVVQD
jgi:hydroxyacylglutathione hydrolase